MLNSQPDSKDKEKIAILLPSLLGGGTERAILTLADEFRNHNKEVHLLILEKGADYDIGDGIIFHFLSPFERNKKDNEYIRKNLYYHKQIYNLIKYLKKQNIKIVLSFLERANLFNVVANNFYAHRVILNSRTNLSKNYGTYISLLKRRIAHAIFKWYLPKAELIICNSKGVKYDLVNNFNIKSNKIKVICNPYDIDKIRLLSTEQLESEYKELFESPVVINVGRLTTPKAQWHLIRAFKKVKEKIKDSKLLILGDGDYEARLKQLAQDTGLAKDIHFLSFQKNPYKFLSKAKVFVLSSIWEGFPNVIVEAMICGITVISTDCRSGPREILAPDTDVSKETVGIEYAKYGILVPTPSGKLTPHNTQLTIEETMMADAIVKLLSDERLRADYASRMSLRVMDFDKDKIVKEYLDTVLSS